MPTTKEQDDAILAYRLAVAAKTLTASSLLVDSTKLATSNAMVSTMTLQIAASEKKLAELTQVEEAAKQRLEEAFGINTNYVEVVEEDRYSGREG